MKIPTMLTIDEISKKFNVPRNFCRRAVVENKVVYVKSGTKYLINAEKFAEYLNTGECLKQTPEQNSEYGQVRPLAVK
ncbi:MAG: excisionase family DNA-binding protein [Defluviitaleaceae bacterium]|nr:excisionase family DNA-binding protein [Defluviitaleaceae bacterium]